uniref:Site-specific DNA-methyltransferase (adenine-specific) n=1 Tax=Acetithermum autotrophicum TaxID=1446466 RepID=H5STZ9_ACEAU|nr:DNA adenine methylase [Candidatus Acetothermum autotrophicum]
MAVPHPIPYQGSKRGIAKLILSFFPNDTQQLIEPFAGSAAVSLAAAYYGKAIRFILNDINEPLMNLWDKIINSPEEIASAYERLWDAQQGREREYYNFVRNQFNKTQSPECLLYLLTRCVKASIRYNSKGEFNQSPDHRRRGTHPCTMRAHILGASRLLRGRTVLQSSDYEEILSYATSLDIVYLDPPYQGVCKNRDPRYLQRISFERFVNSLHALNKRGISFIVSYDGRTGERTYGKLLPQSLDLTHIEVEAGRSSQATLLGYKAHTYESLYLSPALVARLGNSIPKRQRHQLSLLQGTR